MKDIQLYQQVLGLEEPWSVSEVRLDPERQEIVVTVQCAEHTWACPQCHQRAHVHDYQKRRWRHLDTCQFQTIVEARVPRVRCPEHATTTVRVPWAEPKGRFTSLFERLAIDLLQECSLSAAQRILRISWDEVDGIKQRAVKRGLMRRPLKVMPLLSVDEKSWARGYRFATILAEVSPGQPPRVHAVQEGKEKESLDRIWAQMSSSQIHGVKAVAMDMSQAYLSSTRERLEGADGKISHDPFHLVRYMNQAVNDVRKSEHRSLLRMGSSELKGTRFLWLYGVENLNHEYRGRREPLTRKDLKTARAWRIKEAWRWFWWLANADQAREYFHQWYGWAIRSRLGPVKKVARMFKRHLERILNFFKTGLTNGPMEGLNSRIEGLKKKACGYRSFQRFSNDILFHFGCLDLYPTN